MKKRLLLWLFLLTFSGALFSQGVTTSSLAGTVVDEKGEPVMMASVLAIHTPTGTEYGAVTMEDGRFEIRNMRIGGPYKVMTTFVGFETATVQDIYLQLNNTASVKLIMKSTAVQIEGVVIQGSKNTNREQTGAMTNLETKQILSLTTITRSQQDLTRLTPQSDGNSFGGRNNLYNNFSLDGSIFNNSFGLDYATPGGQSDAQPVSLDAIEQIQVSLAPFDVREGGFTGAGINAVTKSGSNQFKATAYTFLRNEKMIGSKVSGVDAPNVDFSTNQTGLSIGGPIIKNKLFFFVNAELERATQLAHGFVAENETNVGQPNVTSVQEADIKAVHDHLLSEWGYEAGAYQGYNHKKSNDKLLLKLNYNIAKNQTLVVRYNMLNAWKDILPHPEAIIGRGPTSFRLPFENESYTIYNKIHSFVGELNSIFSNTISNKLLVGYTIFDDHRTPKSAQFPVIDLFDANGNLAISAGSEMFSTNNLLKQNVFQFTDNLTFYKKKHTITAGVNFEKFHFENSFNLFYYPWHMYFGGVDEFLGLTKEDIDYNAEVVAANQKNYQLAIVDVAQLGLYGQDEWQVNNKFKMTMGLRIDIPIYLKDLAVTAASQEAADFEGWVDQDGNSVKLDPAVWPKSKLMWSPRVGFNYDIKGDNSLTLRGGTGIFTGRIPFVWLGNQASNPGIFPGYTFQVNSTAENFSFPQVWKSDLAVDWRFSEGWVGSFEAIYGKDINAVVHRNYDMLAPSQQLTGADNRAIFGGFNETHIYATSHPDTFLDAGYIVLDNVNEGHQMSLTGKIAKDWKFGLHGDIAYTYMDSKDYTSIPAEIAADAFQRNPVVGNPNTPALSWSRYGLKHRVISSWMYSKEYKSMASTFGIFIEAGQGNRYSYTYAGDLNQDAIANNDLLYVPADQSEIHFGTINESGMGVTAENAAEQWTALNAFIEQDPYLKDRKGKYAERNGVSLPWFSQLDFRFMQDFNFMAKERKHTFQVSLDIMNLGNLINSNWGVRQLSRTTNPIKVNGLDNDNVPYYQFDTNLKSSYVDDFSTRSKWQMQIGIRYIL